MHLGHRIREKGVTVKHKVRLATRAATAGLLLSLILAGVALAATITVDGIREAAWDAGGTQSDADEAGISNELDLKTVEWTNDTSNFYFLIETYAGTLWDRFGLSDPYVLLCINNDNNTSTGTAYPGICPDSGYDRYVAIMGGSSLAVNVYDENFDPIAATTSAANAGAVTEIGVDLASLGFGGANCGSAPTRVFMDGQTFDPDDNVQDEGDIPVTCSAPSAVTLSSMKAQSQVDGLVRGLWALAGLVGLGSMGMLAMGRRRFK